MPSHSRFDDRRMREESLKAFVKALHTDRMIAITGGMSTELLGYPSWNDFVIAYSLIADRLAEEIILIRTDGDGNDRTSTHSLLAEIRERAIQLIKDILKPKEGFVADKRVSMWTLHDLFRAVDREMRQVRAGLVVSNRYQTPSLEEFERRVAAIFLTRMRPDEQVMATIRPLIRSLGIKRIATLNYDLELERAFMLRHDERLLVQAAEYEDKKHLSARVRDVRGANATTTAAGRKAVRDQAHANEPKITESYAAKYAILQDPPSRTADQSTIPAGRMQSVEAFVGDPHSGKPIRRDNRGRLSRTMGDGVDVESDVVNRERVDRLFEFSIGSAEIGRHILHLHGRADSPSTMVANIRQYDRLYRLDDLYRDPFDHGLRMLIGGNPILFVGIGMTESEINEKLQYFVGNTPIRRPAPLFVIWNRKRTNEEKTLLERIRLGHQKPGDEKRKIGFDVEWARNKKARRLDFRVRLGVHLIFEDDFEIEENKRPSPNDDSRAALPKTISELPRLVERVDRRIDRCPDQWRSISSRLTVSDRTKTPCRMWGSKGLESLYLQNHTAEARFKLDEANSSSRNDPNLIFVISENGFGRGELSEYLARSEQQGFRIDTLDINPTEPVNRLLVNAGFSYDSDALLSGIAQFLAKRAGLDGKTVARCRERYFAYGSILKMKPSTLIIINGADRFFGSEGTPLSAEFDHFLRCVNRHGDHLQVLLLGTSRIRKYCEIMKSELQQLGEDIRANRGNTLERDFSDVSLRSSFLEWVAHQYLEKARNLGTADERVIAERHVSDAAGAMMRRAAAIDRDAQKRTFFEAYLSPPLLSALGVDCPATFEALRTLSFIGTPVEGVVLLYAPKVRAILAERNELGDAKQTKLLRTDAFDADHIRRKLEDVIRNLRELGLLLALDPHDPIPGVSDQQDNILWQRYGMHRSLATFVRDRHGAPINDAKLATTFNMSMFMSEPSEATTPETSFHDELGDLVDNLIGAWHDIKQMGTKGMSDLGLFKFLPPEVGSGRTSGPDSVANPGEKWLDLFWKYNSRATEQRFNVSVEDLYIGNGDRQRAIANLHWHAHRDASACLRAALSIVRGYYSTGALLKFDRNERIANADRDGALTEHAHRLDRLISAYGDIVTARSLLRWTAKAEAANGNFKDDDARRTALESVQIAMGPDPFYGDDVVWLFNERATVALAQGHMFEARDALSAADRFNSTHVEKDYHGHNWRRIAIGWVTVRIERGSLKPAERLLDEIDVAVNSAPWTIDGGQTGHNRVDNIRQLFDKDRPTAPLHGTGEFTREELFIVAMSTGYRGLIAHLRGRYHEAKILYEIAVRMLRQLGEQRAYAHFQRHWATLEAFFGKKEDAMREIEHAVAAAQASRQMDILHRARVVRADLVREMSQDEAKRRNALQDIKEALRYAALADCYRVRIEASASLARHMRIGGDYDTALRYGVDAMTIAARYGHSLQKTSLRIELGKILEARGDPISGRALLDQAIAIGTSKGYNHALERVRRALNPTASNTNWTYIKVSG